MQRNVILPEWLDSIIFNEFKAIYHPCPNDVKYGPDQELEHVLVYLGTYFPRSYAEALCIISRLFENPQYAERIKTKEEFNILDFCCGTGGEIFGILMAIEFFFPNIKRVNIDAYDANTWAIRILTHMKESKSCMNMFHKNVNINLSPIFVENDSYLNDITNMSNHEYQLIISFKALNEFIQSRTFGQENVYYKIATSFMPLLSSEGILLLTDVSSKDNDCGEFYPVLMNRGLNRAIHECQIKTIIPHPCYFKEDSCNSCYMQDIFYVTHSHKQNDTSKITYRMLCRTDFANNIMTNIFAPECRASNAIADKTKPYSDL